MFQEPFFLHPPGSRPRDGIYINPMSAYIGEPVKPKDTESFYLHSPHDLVYTRITRLFADTDKHRHFEKKDETLTGKWRESQISRAAAETSTRYARRSLPVTTSRKAKHRNSVLAEATASDSTSPLAAARFVAKHFQRPATRRKTSSTLGFVSLNFVFSYL